MPHSGDRQEHGDVFLAHTELTGHGDDLTKPFNNVAATGTEGGVLVGAGAAPLEGFLIELVFLGHVVAFGEPRHREGTAEEGGLVHSQELTGEDHGGEMGEGHLEGLGPTDHGNFVVQSEVGPRVPIGELVVGRRETLKEDIFQFLDTGVRFPLDFTIYHFIGGLSSRLELHGCGRASQDFFKLFCHNYLLLRV